MSQRDDCQHPVSRKTQRKSLSHPSPSHCKRQPPEHRIHHDTDDCQNPVSGKTQRKHYHIRRIIGPETVTHQTLGAHIIYHPNSELILSFSLFHQKGWDLF